MCGVEMLRGSRDEQDPNLASAQKVHNPVGEVRPSSRSKNEHVYIPQDSAVYKAPSACFCFTLTKAQ